MWNHGKARSLPAKAWGILGIALAMAVLACDANPIPTATPAAAPLPTITRTPTAAATTAPTPTPVPSAVSAPTVTPSPTDTPAPTLTLTPTPTLLPEGGARVIIGDAVYWVDLALTPEERSQGLSGRPSLNIHAGMLFVYDDDGPRTFWMPEMHFPLDMVWIRSDCIVDGVTSDVPNPPADTPRDQLPRYPSTGPVRFILEINAGQADAHGITPGSPVHFAGQIEGRWGC